MAGSRLQFTYKSHTQCALGGAGKLIKPISLSEFAHLPDDVLLTCRRFCSTREHRGPFPFGRTYWWRMLKNGELPSGRKLPGKTGPVHPRYWTAGEVREVIARLTEGAI